MKRLQAFIPSLSLIASFAIAAVAAYMLVAHFQHTILQAWFGASSSEVNQVQVNQVASATVASEQDGDPVCGCPLCCAF